jgi:hypothetical protein
MLTDGKRVMTVGAAVKAMVYALCLAITTIAGPGPSQAQEASSLFFAPLRDSQDVLRGVVSQVGMLGEIQWRSHALPYGREFKTIMPSVTGVASLSRSGLAMEQGDDASLMRFVLAATKVRIQELGVSDNIDVRYPDAWIDRGKVNCDQLRTNFEIESREVALTEDRAIVVVITMVSMQRVRGAIPDHTSECLDGRFPPRTLRDASRIFILEDHDRERALDAIRRELLSMIDRSVVLRIAASNQGALKTIHSWIDSGDN